MIASSPARLRSVAAEQWYPIPLYLRVTWRAFALPANVTARRGLREFYADRSNALRLFLLLEQADMLRKRAAAAA